MDQSDHMLLPLSELWGTAVLQQLVASVTESIYFPSLSSIHWPQSVVIVLTAGHVAEKCTGCKKTGREKKKENHIETREVGKGIKSFYSASSVWTSQCVCFIYYPVQEKIHLTLLIKNIKIPERDGQTSVAHLTAIWFINILLLLKINK